MAARVAAETTVPANWVANAVLALPQRNSMSSGQEPSESLVGLVHEPFVDREQSYTWYLVKSAFRI